MHNKKLQLMEVKLWAVGRVILKVDLSINFFDICGFQSLLVLIQRAKN
jgi:hypothetical protein